MSKEIQGNVDARQIKADDRQGDANVVQMFGGGTPATGDMAVYDAAGNLVSGGPPPAGTGTVTHTGALATGRVVIGNAAADITIGLTDVTTDNVSSAGHGLAPKTPADATQFLNGAATGAYAAVKDSDLSTSDISTNDVSTSKHGFTPKLPNDASKYLDGTGAYSVPTGSSSLTVSGYYLVNDSNYYVAPLMFPATLPVAGNYAWINQGSATETAVGNGLTLKSPNNSGVSIHIRKRALSGHATLIAVFQTNVYPSGAGNSCGVGFRESATGKLSTFGPVQGAPSGYYVSRWASATSYTSSPFSEDAITVLGWPLHYVKINYNGTNVTYFRSNNGVDWDQLYTEVKTASFTTAPDEWFYYVDPEATAEAYINLLSWAES